MFSDSISVEPHARSSNAVVTPFSNALVWSITSGWSKWTWSGWIWVVFAKNFGLEDIFVAGYKEGLVLGKKPGINFGL